MTDLKTIAEQIVSTWPTITAEQSALIGSVMNGGAK